MHQLGLSRTSATQPHHFAKVIDEPAAGENVNCREVLCASWVIMIAMDCEYGDADIQVWVLKIDTPASQPS